MRAGSRPSFLEAIVLLGLVAGGSGCRDDAPAPDAMGTTGSTSDPGSSTNAGSTADPDTTAGVGTETGVGGCVDDADCERGFVCESVCVEVTTHTASKVIGPEGGSVQVVGAGLEIPPGALLEPTEITLTRTEQEPPLDFAPSSALFQLSPEGLRFHEPANLWLAREQPGSMRPRLYSSSEDAQGYERLRTRASEAYLEAWVWHFSVFFAGDTFPSLHYLGRVPARVGLDCNAPDEIGAFTESWAFRVDDLPEGHEITRLENEHGGIWVVGDSCNEVANWPLRVEPGQDGSSLLYAAPFPGNSPSLGDRFILTTSPSTQAVFGQQAPIETIIGGCWALSITTALPFVTVSRLDTCSCFDAVFSGAANCWDPDQETLVSCGPAWDWRANSFNGDCTLETGAQVIAQHRGRDLLLDAAGLPDEADNGSLAVDTCSGSYTEYFGQGCKRRCAILEQARTLCAGQPYVPDFDDDDNQPAATDVEQRQTRRALCHPGVEVNCEPEDAPDYASITATIQDATLRDAMQQQLSGLVEMSHNYCTGQVQGGANGATSLEHVPYATAIPPYAVPGAEEGMWTCPGGEDPHDIDAIEAILRSYGGSLLGMTSSDIDNLVCPLERALLECVAPNLGAGTPCTTAIDADGTAYGPWTDYCFGFALGKSNESFCATADGNAHCDGRAIDLNSRLEDDYANDGNIDQCVGLPEGECTNTFEVPRLDLPPGFVAVMEGCGLQWLGRSNLAEGGNSGCDPMHFEVPNVQ